MSVFPQFKNVTARGCGRAEGGLEARRSAAPEGARRAPASHRRAAGDRCRAAQSGEGLGAGLVAPPLNYHQNRIGQLENDQPSIVASSDKISRPTRSQNYLLCDRRILCRYRTNSLLRPRHRKYLGDCDIVTGLLAASFSFGIVLYSVCQSISRTAQWKGILILSILSTIY